MYSGYIYICFVTTEHYCRQSRVLQSKVQLANRVIPVYLYDNRDPINQGCFVSIFRFRHSVFPSLKLGVLVLH